MECSRWNSCWGFNISKVHGSDPAALFHKNDYWNKKGLQNFPFMPHPYLMKGVRAWGSTLPLHWTGPCYSKQQCSIRDLCLLRQTSSSSVLLGSTLPDIYQPRPFGFQPWQTLSSSVILGSNLKAAPSFGSSLTSGTNSLFIHLTAIGEAS